jgi:chromosome segregation ATPase
MTSGSESGKADVTPTSRGGNESELRVASPRAKSGDAPGAAALQAKLRAVKRKLEVREQALAVLNRRLLKLERGENGAGGMVRAMGTEYVQIQDLSAEMESDETQIQTLSAEVASLREANRALQEELFWLRNSRVYRWSGPVRSVYHKVRRR